MYPTVQAAVATLSRMHMEVCRKLKNIFASTIGKELLLQATSDAMIGASLSKLQFSDAVGKFSAYVRTYIRPAWSIYRKCYGVPISTACP